MRIIRERTFAKAYEEILCQVMRYPEYVTSPRGMQINEINNMIVQIINPMSNLFKNKIRSINPQYLAGELIWYFTGMNDLKFIEKFSKFWRKIANDDGTCNSAYGYLLFQDNVFPNCGQPHQDMSEWDWAFKSLIKDKDSRQAIIHFNKPWHMYEDNKDFPCTIYGNFHIRDNKLMFTINMRSSDSIFGTTFDIPFFMLLQQQMWKLLKEKKYKDLELGLFTYMSNSQHIYEKDFELVEEMLKFDFEDDALLPIGENLIRPYVHNDLLETYNFINGRIPKPIFTKDPLILKIITDAQSILYT